MYIIAGYCGKIKVFTTYFATKFALYHFSIATHNKRNNKFYSTNVIYFIIYVKLKIYFETKYDYFSGNLVVI